MPDNRMKFPKVIPALLLTIITTNMFAQEIERGVSQKLAQQRKASIQNVEYDLYFQLRKTEPIEATLKVRWGALANTENVILDFTAPAENIHKVLIGGQSVDAKIENGHITIPLKGTSSPEVEIHFTAGDQSLNRNENFLYTLLVPDRASTVFPCFDQPDLKARFKLSLELPDGWIASANGELEPQGDEVEGSNAVVFQRTKPISTYLFAFTAGEFQTITREINGRKMTMLHRESDAEKVQRNVDKIFETHAFSLDWLEKYTAIKYPFAKFDFVLIPAFQYGGMEHIGNIFYNADQLFLDESATTDQKLNRASLIAHETAHMWFGNLVTMKWFDDVWLKEVFANFMAAKIVNPSFPEINHDLGFLLKHHPSAYGEDRTDGTYPIQQKLDNLRNAGTLYGRIIYQKAPIVMRQLETMIGQPAMQEGLQEYLAKFSYSNAVWDDLIEILDAKTDLDLASWSETWVKEPGTPEVASAVAAESGKPMSIELRQTRRSNNQKFWTQSVDVKVFANDKLAYQTRVMIEGETTKVELPKELEEYDFFLANGSELGYGYFQLDAQSQNWLLENIHRIENDVTRGAAWLALYETLIRGNQTIDISPTSFLNALLNGLDAETEPLNRQNILNQLSTVYWKFMSTNQREAFAPLIEEALWNWIDESWDDNRECPNDARAAYYRSLVRVAMTEDTIERLYQIWESESKINGLKLSERDFSSLACEIALRLPTKSEKILSTQLERIKNADRKRRFEFIIPSLSPNQQTRDTFFESLKAAENRRPERWALDGLQYLHHPLRAESSEKYILPSLELLEEIQTTGDIFFPKRWLVETFSGHRTKTAAAVVTQFLADRPEYSFRLRNKILQAADLTLRVAK